MERGDIIYIDSLEDLEAHVFTIGYPSEGETILFILCNKGKPVFTSLTDCYMTDDCNHIENLMSGLGINNIDAFFWTHPDKDHSLGIRDVLDKFDAGKNAHIFLPSTLDSDDAYNIAEDIKKSLRYLLDNYNSRKKYRIHQACVSEGECRSLFYFDIIELKNRSCIRCDFKCLAPIDAIVLRRKYNVSKNKTNDLSIVYAIEINGSKLLFTGDLTNQTAQFLDGGYLQNVKLIKIPHHASDEPRRFNGLLFSYNISDIVSVTTIKSPLHPVMSVIDEYKKLGHSVYSTGTGNEKYGCIEYCMNVKNILTSVTCTGNAIQL